MHILLTRHGEGRETEEIGGGGYLTFYNAKNVRYLILCYSIGTSLFKVMLISCKTIHQLLFSWVGTSFLNVPHSSSRKRLHHLLKPILLAKIH